MAVFIPARNLLLPPTSTITETKALNTIVNYEDTDVNTAKMLRIYYLKRQRSWLQITSRSALKYLVAVTTGKFAYRVEDNFWVSYKA